MDFAVSADHRTKLKESEKNKFLDLARELKKLGNMKVTFLPIIIDTFGTVTKELIEGLEDLEIKGQRETIQTTVLLRSDRILRRVLEIEEIYCHSHSRERPSSNSDVKNFQGVRIIIKKTECLIISV